MKLRTWIVDDEPLARELLKSYAQKCDFLEILGTAHSAEHFLNQADLKQIDLLFLDIQMPGVLGTHLAAQLQNNLPMVIFSTAYEQYAVDGFKLNALDYLLKPYPLSEFLRAAHKALEYFKLLQAPSSSPSQTFFVRSDHKQVRIDVDKILYIEGMKDYVKIYLDDQIKPVITLMRMKNLEELLPSTLFLRVHRSYIAHVRKIETLHKNEISMGGKTMPISDKMREDLEKRLQIQ